MRKLLSAVLVAALGIQLISIPAWAGSQTDLSEIPVEEEQPAEEARFDYPVDWDEEDPLNERAYRQIYDTPQAAPLLSSQNTAAGVTTTWPTSSGASTFRHNSVNTTGRNLITGIDVSYHNGSINWNKVKAAGIEFVIIRAGYRGTSTGSLNKDTQFDNYIQGAQAAGLKVGVYFFSQALTRAEAQAEASYTLDIINGYQLDLPVAFDYEDYSGGRLTNANLSKTKKTNIALTFCKAVENAGYPAMVYANSSWFYSQLDAETIGKSYMLWMARYNTYSYEESADSGSSMYPGQIDIWQCTSTAQVSGISTNVDLDYWYSPENGTTTVSQNSRTKSSVTISWNSLSDADGYAIRLSKSRNGTYSLVARVDASVTSYKITGLDQGTEYYVKIRGYTINNDGTVNNAKFSAPAAVITSETLGTRIITKKALALRKWAGTGYKKLVRIPKSTTLRAKAVTAAKNGKVWYKVIYKSKGVSYTGYIPATGTNQCVKTVSGIAQAACRKKSVSLKWTKVPEASGYAIYRSTSRNGKYTCIGRVNGRATVTYTDTGLKQGWEYYYKVRAYRDVNGSRTYGTASSAAILHTKKSSTITIRTKSSANLRKYAGTSYKALAIVPNGKTFTVLFRTKDKSGKTWYKVKYNVNGKTKKGYLSASTVKRI